MIKNNIAITKQELSLFMNRKLLPMILAYLAVFFFRWFENIWSDFWFVIQSHSLKVVLSASLQYLLFGVFWVLGGFVHELIHGFVFGLCCKHKFKSIRFGIKKNPFMYYTACNEPLPKWAFITGGIMPAIVLGFLPAIIAMVTGHLGFALFSAIFIYGAGGDFLMIYKALGIKGDYLFGGDDEADVVEALGFNVVTKP